MGKQLQKMKVTMPLFKGMEVKPNLLQLIIAKANLPAYYTSEVIKVLKGA